MKPFAYICTLMRDEFRVNNVENEILPYLDNTFCTAWPAIDGTSPALDGFLQNRLDITINFSEINKNVYGTPRTVLSILCSAIEILEDARAKNRSPILFLEDDVKINEGFYEKLETLTNSLPQDADFLKFYSKLHPNHQPLDVLIAQNKPLIEIFPDYFYDTKWHGADCMFLTTNGIQKVLELLYSSRYSLDDLFFYGAKNKDLVGFVTRTNDLCRHKHQDFKSNNCRCNRDIPSTPFMRNP